MEGKLQNVIGTSIYDIKNEWKEVIREKLENDLFDCKRMIILKRKLKPFHQKAVKEGVRVDGRDLVYL